MSGTKVKGGATTIKKSHTQNIAARKAHRFSFRRAVAGWHRAHLSIAMPHVMGENQRNAWTHADLIARPLAGGSSSVAVTDGQDHEGGASTALCTTPVDAAIPCLLPSRVRACYNDGMPARCGCFNLVSSFSAPIAGSQLGSNLVASGLSPHLLSDCHSAETDGF